MTHYTSTVQNCCTIDEWYVSTERLSSLDVNVYIYTHTHVSTSVLVVVYSLYRVMFPSQIFWAICTDYMGISLKATRMHSYSIARLLYHILHRAAAKYRKETPSAVIPFRCTYLV